MPTGSSPFLTEGTDPFENGDTERSVNMAFDFKKEYKEFYLPKNKPELIQVPAMRYVAVRGEGNPNLPEGAYQRAIGVLYAVA